MEVCQICSMKNLELWSEATQLMERSDSISGAKRLSSGDLGAVAPPGLPPFPYSLTVRGISLGWWFDLTWLNIEIMEAKNQISISAF